METFYTGALTACNWCSTPFAAAVDTKMYDAKSQIGPWGNFCEKCFKFQTTRGELGAGRGQEYTRQADGRWLKTGG